MNEFDEYINRRLTTIGKTRGCRFNASRRLNNQYQFSITSISILSVFGIAIPIIQNNIDTTKCSNINTLYTLVSILLSIFILVLSLLEGSKNYQVKAERLHINAVEISSVYHQLEQLRDIPTKEEIEQKLKDINKKYDKLIRICPENHEPDDYLLFQAQYNENCKISRLRSTYLKIKYYWLYFVLVLTISMVTIYLYSACPI